MLKKLIVLIVVSISLTSCEKECLRKLDDQGCAVCYLEKDGWSCQEQSCDNLSAEKQAENRKQAHKCIKEGYRLFN